MKSTLQIIQDIISGLTTPSDISQFNYMASIYSKFLVDSISDGEILIVWHNGPESYFTLKEDYALSLYASSHADSLETSTLTTDEVSEIQSEWISIKDIALPKAVGPTIKDLLNLPSLGSVTASTSLIKIVYSGYIPGDVDCLDFTSIPSDILSGLELDTLLSKTTNYENSGDVIIRMNLDGKTVAILHKFGRWLDCVDIYLIDHVSLMEFLHEIRDCISEDEVYEDLPLDSLMTFGGDLIDDLYEGIQTNTKE